MTRIPSSVGRAAHRDKASLCNAIDSPASSSTITTAEAGHGSDHSERVSSLVTTHDPDLSTVFMPATDLSVPAKRTSSSMPVIHLSQAPPITKW